MSLSNFYDTKRIIPNEIRIQNNTVTSNDDLRIINNEIKNVTKIEGLLPPVVPIGTNNAALQAAFVKSTHVRLDSKLTYTLDNYELPGNALLDCNHAVIKRSNPNNPAIIVRYFRSQIINGQINGDFLGGFGTANSTYPSAGGIRCTIQSAASENSTSITVNDPSNALATDMSGGFICVFSSRAYGSEFGTREVPYFYEISSIASLGSNQYQLNLVQATGSDGSNINSNFVLGTISSGDVCYIGFEMIRMAGGIDSLISDMRFQNCFIGIKTGDRKIAANTYFTIRDCFFEQISGCSILSSSNAVGDRVTNIKINGGVNTRSTQNITTGSYNYSYPYAINYHIQRWDLPPLSVTLNETKQVLVPKTEWTVNQSTKQVEIIGTGRTKLDAVTNGSGLQIDNYEYSCAGIACTDIEQAGADEIGFISGILLACYIGLHIRNCTLLRSELTIDSTDLACLFAIDSTEIIQYKPTLFSRFGIVFINCVACAINNAFTSLLPDASELNVTSNKAEIVISGGSLNKINRGSWQSKNGYTTRIDSTTQSTDNVFNSPLILPASYNFDRAINGGGSRVSGNANIAIYNDSGNITVESIDAATPATKKLIHLNKYGGNVTVLQNTSGTFTNNGVLENKGNINITGTSTFQNPVTINGTLNVTGNTTLGFPVTVNSTLTTNGTIRGGSLVAATGAHVSIYGDQADELVIEAFDSTNTSSKSRIWFNKYGGAITIGQNSSANLTINSTVTGLLLGSSVTLTNDNSYDIGTNAVALADIYSNNALTVTSDRRFKNNITFSDRGLDFVLRLEPVSYTLKDGKRPHYGFISQQVEKLIKEDGKDFAGWVKEDVKDGKQSLRYNEFISIIVKAIQELNDKLDFNPQEEFTNDEILEDDKRIGNLENVVMEKNEMMVALNAENLKLKTEFQKIKNENLDLINRMNLLESRVDKILSSRPKSPIRPIITRRQNPRRLSVSRGVRKTKK